MHRILFLLCFLLILSSCGCKEVPQVVTVESDSYHLQGYQFQVLFKTPLTSDMVFKINDELALAKVIQYQYESGNTTSCFTSTKEIDLDKTSDYLSHLNPFDMKLTLHTNTVEDETTQKTYRQQSIVFENIDPFYEDAVEYAKQNLVNIVQDGMTTQDKIKAIHDDLIRRVTYDTKMLVRKDTSSNSFSAYGALLEKKAVCAGYSRAFMIYAKLLKIPCLYVTAAGIDHAWNLVQVDDTWLHVDTTWDDQKEKSLQKEYLNKTELEFFEDGKHVYDIEEATEFYQTLQKQFFTR